MLFAPAFAGRQVVTAQNNIVNSVHFIYYNPLEIADYSLGKKQND